MRKRALLVWYFIFFSLWSIELLQAGEVKRLNITIRDGKVSADIHGVSIREVILEIGKKWGIEVEVYGKVDQDRRIYSQFEGLTLREGLDRVLRGINFVYTENEKLCLLGFGDSSLKHEADLTSIITISSAQEADQDEGSPLASEPSSTQRGTDQVASGSRVSGLREERTEGNRTHRIGERREALDDRKGTFALSGEAQHLGQISASFTIPIILDAMGQAISALSNDIVYDPNLLANPKVSISESAKQVGKEAVFNVVRPGLLRVGIMGLNQNLIPDGVTANITFDVLKEGSVSLINQPTASDPHGNKVPVIFKNGKITIAK